MRVVPVNHGLGSLYKKYLFHVSNFVVYYVNILWVNMQNFRKIYLSIAFLYKIQKYIMHADSVYADDITYFYPSLSYTWRLPFFKVFSIVGDTFPMSFYQILIHNTKPFTFQWTINLFLHIQLNLSWQPPALNSQF